MRSLIASFKLFAFLVLSFFTLITQGTLFLLFKDSAVFYLFPKFFHKMASFIFRIKISVSGTPLNSNNVVYVGNHLSYIDIPVIGSYLNASFIAKAEVRSWPILGTLAYVANTIFIKRTRTALAQCIADIKASLMRERSLILFPEGTSSDGMTVLPFKSSLFDLFLHKDLKDKVIVQPMTVSLIKVNGAPPKTSDDFDIYAWHGDMTFGPHIWNLAKSKGAEIRLTFHKAYPAKDYDDRKAFAKDCHSVVAQELKNTLPAPLDFQAQEQ